MVTELLPRISLRYWIIVLEVSIAGAQTRNTFVRVSSLYSIDKLLASLWKGQDVRVQIIATAIIDIFSNTISITVINSASAHILKSD
jgi:hypothetical protein